jgi:hypothetical protein
MLRCLHGFPLLFGRGPMTLRTPRNMRPTLGHSGLTGCGLCFGRHRFATLAANPTQVLAQDSRDVLFALHVTVDNKQVVIYHNRFDSVKGFPGLFFRDQI